MVRTCYRNIPGAAMVLLFASVCSGADKVVVAEATGTWIRVSPPNQNGELRPHQYLEVAQRIRFAAEEPFVPGILALADGATGQVYFTKPCKVRESCAGVFEVPAPKSNTTPAEQTSLLAKIYRRIVDSINDDGD